MLDTAARTLLDIVDLAIITVAVVRIARLRPDPHGRPRLAKGRWILVAVFGSWYLGPILVPFGALAAIVRTWRAGRPRPGAIPVATGQRRGRR